MKFARLLIAFSPFIFLSCAKEDVSYSNSPVSLDGTWNYIGYSGGFGGSPFTPVNSEGPYIQVRGTQLIITYGNQGPQKCMQYQFQKDSVSNGYYQLTGLLTTSDTSFMLPMPDMKNYLVAIYNDTLTLYPTQCSDCFTTHYTPSLKNFTCMGDTQ